MVGKLSHYDKQKFIELSKQYEKLEKPITNNLEIIQSQQEELLRRFIPLNLVHEIKRLVFTNNFGWWYLGGFCIATSLMGTLDEIDPLDGFMILLGPAFLFYLLPEHFLSGLNSLIRPLAKQFYKTELKLLDHERLAVLKDLEKLREEFDKKYDLLCVTATSYPPDWGIRRARVIKRDNNKCVNCGWPDGYIRRSRELHVHHITPISAGGNHHMSNLQTLCHVCHRNVDESHQGVRNSRRKPRN